MTDASQTTPSVRVEGASVKVGDKVALGATMFGLPAGTVLTVAKIYPCNVCPLYAQPVAANRASLRTRCHDPAQ